MSSSRLPLSAGHTLKYISPEELAHLILGEDPSSLLIVDVRDHDYTGGRIPGSVNITLADLIEDPTGWPRLRKLLSKARLAIFHCHFSQSRAPAAARWVIEQLGGRVRTPDPRGTPSIETMTGHEETAMTHKSPSINGISSIESSPKRVNTPESSCSSSNHHHCHHLDLDIDIKVLQGGWAAWNEHYAGHPQLYQAIHPGKNH